MKKYETFFGFRSDEYEFIEIIPKFNTDIPVLTNGIVGIYCIFGTKLMQ